MAAMVDADDPYALAGQAADALAEALGRTTHNVAVVLGSGWGPAADQMGELTGEVPTRELPGFPPSTVAGHGGTVRSVDADGRGVLVFFGRVHGYEGNPVSAVVHNVRTAASAGCRAVVLTNAAGSLREEWSPGQPVVIADHLNLTGLSPLAGPEAPPPYGPRFTDLTEAWSSRLRGIVHELAPELPEGVYAGLNGPQYETPAEIRMLRTLGADLVGMSTVLEAIAARHAGLEVVGFSLVTNLAAGLAPVPLDHQEVLAAGADVGTRLGGLLADLVRRII
jgi:purine-nucleoside phosphorylase